MKWIWLGAAVICFLVWMGERSEGTKSLKWPSTAGVVTDSSISESRDKDGDRTQNVKVAYTYAVGGKTLKGDRVCIGNSGQSPTAIVARYPKGAAVQVFYDPDNPEAAVLEPGAGGAGMWMVFGILALLAAAWTFFRGRRPAAVQKAPA